MMKRSMIIHPEELSFAWIDRLADVGIGTLGIHPRGGKRAYETLEELLALMQGEQYRGMIDYAKNRGLAVEYELHGAGYLMPRELFVEHPEYFRMNEHGQRTDECNFCVTNADALDLYARRAAELALALYGSSLNFYFWMDDGHALHCHCPRCAHLSPSDQQLLVLNRVLREIRKHLPDARVAYLAYMDTVVPPSKTRAEDGIFLEYAPFAKYTAKGEDAAECIAREKEMMAPLMQFFETGEKKVLEYWYDNSLFSGWKKPPVKFTLNEEAMREDIAEYLALGFDSISTFACFLGKDYEELHGGVDIAPFAECTASESAFML